MYDQQTRAAVVHGDFVTLKLGESMQFRIVSVSPIKTIDGENGPYDVSPHEVIVDWHRDAVGNITNPIGADGGGLEWTPAAAKMDRILALNDQLSQLTGNPRELANHSIIVNVTEEKGKGTRKYHVYNVKLADPNALANLQAGGRSAAPAARPAAPPPPVPGRSAPPPATTSPQSIVAQATAALHACTTIEQLMAELQVQWPAVSAAKMGPTVTPIFREKKIEIMRQTLLSAPDQAGIDYVWQLHSGKFERTPEDLARVTAHYHDAVAALGQPMDDIPF